MAIEIVMPQMGADMQEGTLLRWLKQPGDHVARGEAIAEIETDKANVELESFEEGVLEQTLASEGEVIPVGQAVALIGSGSPSSTGAAPGTAVPRTEPAAPPPAPIAAVESAEPVAPAAPQAQQVQQAETAAPAGADGERTRVSPVARTMARQLGIDLARLHGSGPDGRIVRRDVEAAAGSSPRREAQAPVGPVASAGPLPPTAEGAAPRAATSELSESLRAEATRPATEAAATPTVDTPAPAVPGPATEQPAKAAPAPAAGVQPLSRMRQTIARRMAQSKREAPHYYVTAEIDMTEAMALRETLNRPQDGGGGSHVSVNDMIVKACADALRRFPAFNASYGDDGLHRHVEINVCIAIALPDGLIAPALLNVGEKSLGAIAREARDLAERARGGGLRAPEINDGTFTVSNLGMYGIETLIPIIQPGQAAILGVGAVLDKPAVRDGQIVARRLMMAALAADHRATDGAQGAEFLREIKSLLEEPVRLAL